MESYSRVRSIKLRRLSVDDPFGFTVRGGQEHGTGIFVSSVTPKSIAHKQGLKTGDQILRVNGYAVSVATHAECLSLMRLRTNLHLKIRSVGMIPVKEGGQPLTWRLVENIHSATTEKKRSDDKGHSPDLRPAHQLLMSRMSDTSSQAESQEHGQEVKVYINTNGHLGLGCCICRGPVERPGIFVQSTKSNGVAREAGLRPGDQILECNGHSFNGIEFPEAVYHLKGSKELRLLVIKGAASDLFPGESSGYNSSASSINGETITTRVSIGSESSASSETHVEDVRSRVSMVTIEEGGDETARSRVALDRNMEWDEVEQVWRSAAAQKESLIIEIKGEDPVDQIRNEEIRLSIERRKLEEEQQKLIQEAQRLEAERLQFEEEKRRILEEAELASRSASASSNDSAPLNTNNRDLAGALTNEILKRTERRELQRQNRTNDEGGNEKKAATAFTAPVDDLKRQQHEQLIEEFKRAHRKMFAHTVEEGAGVEKNGFPPREERASFRAKRIQKEAEHTRIMVQNRVEGIVRQRQLRIERQHQEVQETEREVSKFVDGKGKPVAPPPPPPVTDKRKSIPEPKMPQLSQNGKLPSLVPKSSNPAIPAGTDKMDEEIKKEEKVTPSNGVDRPESPSPDYSNSPSPEPRRRQTAFKNSKGQTPLYSSPPDTSHFVRHPESQFRQTGFENSYSNSHISQDKSRRNAARILVKSTAQLHWGQPPKMTSTGILKKTNSCSSDGSNSTHLKSISFGKF